MLQAVLIARRTQSLPDNRKAAAPAQAVGGVVTHGKGRIADGRRG